MLLIIESVFRKSILGIERTSSVKKWAESGAVLFVIFIWIASPEMTAHASNGAELFNKHCLVCHPRAAMMSGVRIVEIMRTPPPAMPTFDNDKISDREADAIADYIRLQIAMHASNGAALFKKHCLVCHPRAAMMSGVRIVEIMRTPPPAMPTFKNDKISDSDAGAIADYIRLQIAMKSICKAFLMRKPGAKNL